MYERWAKLLFRKAQIMCFAFLLVACTSVVGEPDIDPNDHHGGGQGAMNLVEIDVYFHNVSGCPIFTSFNGSPKPPELDKSNPNVQLKWKAVGFPDPVELPATPTDKFKFAVIFDPLQSGGPVASGAYTGNGPLPEAGPVNLAAEETLPSGVDFKYTVVRVTEQGDVVGSCDPLDPMVRIL